MDKNKLPKEKSDTDKEKGKKKEEKIISSKLMEPPIGYKSEGPGS